MQVSIAPKGQNKMRLAIAMAATNNGERQSIVSYCRNRWGEGAGVVILAHDQITRSAVPSLNTTTQDGLAPDSASLEIIEPVVERTVFRGANSVPFNVRLATVSGADAPAWMTEGAGVPVGDATVSYETLRPKRLATMGVITEEMLQHSQAEAILRRQFTGLLARAINDAALDVTNDGSATKPASLTYGKPVRESLSAMMADYDGDLQRGIWYGTPELFLSMQSNENPDLGIGGGTYRGSVAIASRSAPANTLVLIDPAGISLALGPLEIDSSKNASFQMDTAPTGQNRRQPLAKSSACSRATPSHCAPKCTRIGRPRRALSRWSKSSPARQSRRL
jgi:Phage capsid family